jgi:aminodeoxyfutalosine synthase
MLNKWLNADSFLEKIEQKIQAKTRLGFEDGMTLYQSPDLFTLGQLAQQTARGKNGNACYYSINLHIHYTNICVNGCRFCGFSRTAEAADAYVLTAEEVAAQAEEAWGGGATEVHIVGGIHPELPLHYYLEMVGKIHQKCPGLHVKAFTATEIQNMGERAGKTIAEVLSRLREAGLGSLPGGGAEILSEGYFRENCPKKAGPGQWLAVHAAAHRLGIMTNATMLYGYTESLEERVGHLLKLREAQDQSLQEDKGHFQCFVPLPYIPPVGSGQEKNIDAISDLKTIAISRLLLDNFNHIKAFWPMLGVNLAQVALAFGADDLDGTVEQYEIVPQQNGRASLAAGTIRRLIAEAGLSPVQRSPFYQPIGQ